MKILALDLGKFKTVFCNYYTNTADHHFGTLATTPQAMHDLFVEHQPDRLVIEVSHVKTRRKQAAVALARKVLIWCWAMLRDGGTWQSDREQPTMT